MNLPFTHSRYPRLLVLAGIALAACSEAPLDPSGTLDLEPAFDHTTEHNVFTSGSHVMTWDPIIPASMPSDWQTSVCTATPAVGPNAAWTNPHNAFEVWHSWQGTLGAPWINAWNNRFSSGSGGSAPYHNWTKYETSVTGNGSFVLSLLADNCSWIYLDGTLVGFQGDPWNANDLSYGVTLNGTHTLTFVVFDGGGDSGGQYLLETTSNPPPPLNPDLDGDGHENDLDEFPLDPTEWADTDGDGVGDNADAFDGSDMRATVFVGTCNTGVPNRHLGDGSWFNDLIGAAQTAASNHGAFVRSVADLANAWKKDGLISGREHGAIVSCAARSK